MDSSKTYLYCPMGIPANGKNINMRGKIKGKTTVKAQLILIWGVSAQ